MATRREQVTADIGVRRAVLLASGDVVPMDDAVGVAGPAFDALLGLRAPAVPSPSEGETGERLFAWGWAGSESAADPGHLRFYPAGALVFALVKEWLESWVSQELGGSPIRTSMLYRWSNEPIGLEDLVGTFEERVYHVDGGAVPLFLRFAGDPGVFSMLNGRALTDRQLPLRLYEGLDAFRRNRSGERRRMRRARSFFLVDHHTVCRDLRQAEDEYVAILDRQLAMHRDARLDVAVELTVTEEGLRKKRRLLERITDSAGPVALEILTGEKHYWSLKHVLYSDVGERTLNSQLDLENGRRFGIVGADGNACPIIHATTGTVERWMLVLVGQGARATVPVLPLWMAPTQVRLLPVGEDNLDTAVRIAEELGRAGLRVDVDDRSKSLGARVRQAELEWTPFTAVVGAAEQASGHLAVRERGGQRQTMSPEQLLARLRDARGAYSALRKAPQFLLSTDPFARWR